MFSMKIRQIHHLSGLLISIFVGLHLFNHFMSVFGAEAHLTLMDQLRLIYRNIILETILLLAIGVQIVSGLKLFFSKRKGKQHFYGKLQIWTGLYLAFFLVIHLGAVFVGRYLLNLDTNFYFGVAGLNTFPFNLFFIPYYGLATLSFFGHLAAIHFHKMKIEVIGLTVEQQSRLILIKGIIVTLVLLYGLTNGFTGVEIPVEYHIMIGK